MNKILLQRAARHREHATTFLVHGSNDQSVPVEMHLYQNAPHGFGLRSGHGAASAWPKLCEVWLLATGWLP